MLCLRCARHCALRGGDPLFLLTQECTHLLAHLGKAAACRSPKIHPLRCDAFIAMVKTSELWQFDDGAAIQNRTLDRTLLSLTVAHGEADSGFEIHSRRASRGYQHATFVPADMPVWGYSDGIRSVRELRMSFPPALLGSILGDELDRAKIDKPVLMLYDDQITRYAALLADECREPLIGSRLYGENLTTALTAALFTSRKAPTRRAQGLSRWQLRQAVDYLEGHMMQDISLEDGQTGRAFPVTVRSIV